MSERQRPVYIYVAIPEEEVTREMLEYCAGESDTVRITPEGQELVLLKFTRDHEMFKNYTKYTHAQVLEFLNFAWAKIDIVEEIFPIERLLEMMARYQIRDFNTLSGVIDQNFDLPIIGMEPK